MSTKQLAAKAVLACALAASGALLAQSTSTYSGVCDASAAAALDAKHFVVANDEDNTLRVYRFGLPNSVWSFDLSAFLQTEPGKEADIEGSAVLGGRIYWISSHGLSAKKGNFEPGRLRFFATEVQPGSPPTVTTVGSPYKSLLQDLADTAELKRYGLDAAAGRKPEDNDGLNIEGLAATPDGKLLIGFRNPLAKGRALVIPLENPAEVIDGKRARLGKAIELDLGRRGIRSIELVGARYFIVAGSTDNRYDFALFQWSGEPNEKPIRIKGVELGDLRPEGLIEIPGSTGLLLLSDDGGVMAGKDECKELQLERRAFRTLTVTR